MIDQVKAGDRANQIARLIIRCFVLLLLLAMGTKALISNGNQAAARPSLPQKADGTIQPTNSPAFQRTKTIELAPVASSTQPLAPSTVSGQTQVDASTIALYHFDVPNSSALDATSNYTGTLAGNAAIAPTGLYSGVLTLDGNSSYVRLGNLGSPISGTVEAFVDYSSVSCPNASGNFPIVYAGGEFGSGEQGALFLGERGGLVFGIYSNGHWTWANSGINGCRYLTGAPGAGTSKWPYETWRFHHVAGTWGPRGMEIWVDGVLHGVANNNPFLVSEPYPYMCNPQAQGASVIYPLCTTPVPFPTMTSFPPGDYTGGLPSYATFLIGCGADWSDPSTTRCFNGRIDEVRVSNVQRIFQCLGPVGPYGPAQCVVPTITPTPTQTPVPIAEEYALDSNTVALYHLNQLYPGGTVREEVSGQNPSIGAQAIISNTGRFNSAYSAIGTWDSRLGIPSSPYLPNLGAGTVEAWVKFSNSTDNYYIFTARQHYNGGNGVLDFGLASGRIRLIVGGISLDSDILVSSLVGCWHHIGGTFGPRGMEIWIDAQLHGTNASTAVIGGIDNGGWQMGCDFYARCMNGTLDEIRISKVQRRFTLQSPSFRPISRAPSPLGFLTFLPFLRSSPSSGCAFGP